MTLADEIAKKAAENAISDASSAQYILIGLKDDGLPYDTTGGSAKILDYSKIKLSKTQLNKYNLPELINIILLNS